MKKQTSKTTEWSERKKNRLNGILISIDDNDVLLLLLLRYETAVKRIVCVSYTVDCHWICDEWKSYEISARFRRHGDAVVVSSTATRLCVAPWRCKSMSAWLSQRLFSPVGSLRMSFVLVSARLLDIDCLKTLFSMIFSFFFSLARSRSLFPFIDNKFFKCVLLLSDNSILIFICVDRERKTAPYECHAWDSSGETMTRKAMAFDRTELFTWIVFSYAHTFVSPSTLRHLKHEPFSCQLPSLLSSSLPNVEFIKCGTKRRSSFIQAWMKIRSARRSLCRGRCDKQTWNKEILDKRKTRWKC